MEYAWNVSPSNYVKCDPCVSNPPNNEDLKSAGVWWTGKDKYNEYVNEYEPGKAEVYFTRLHIRYNRKAFPQDLSFEVTPNTENYQTRYIITHPATGQFNCDEGKKYLKDLRSRRKKEMEMLSWLTGKDGNEGNISFNDEENENISMESRYQYLASENKSAPPGSYPATPILLASVMILGFLTLWKLKNLV